MSRCENCNRSVPEKERLVVNGHVYCLAQECIDAAFVPVGRTVRAVLEAAKRLEDAEAER